MPKFGISPDLEDQKTRLEVAREFTSFGLIPCDEDGIPINLKHTQPQPIPISLGILIKPKLTLVEHISDILHLQKRLKIGIGFIHFNPENPEEGCNRTIELRGTKYKKVIVDFATHLEKVYEVKIYIVQSTTYPFYERVTERHDP